MGDCVKPVGKADAYDLNCSNFNTQAEAQGKYDYCAEQIASNKELDRANNVSRCLRLKWQ
ncbi:MAG: hypothetical protein ACI8PW_000986 [Methylophilaceae bacterium]|jgi:hypothetical protein